MLVWLAKRIRLITRLRSVAMRWGPLPAERSPSASRRRSRPGRHPLLRPAPCPNGLEPTRRSGEAAGVVEGRSRTAGGDIAIHRSTARVEPAGEARTA